LVGIVLPNILGVKGPLYTAISFSSVWAAYSLILLGCVFLVEVRRSRNGSNEEDLFPPELIQEREALWEITIKGNKGQEMSHTNWN
jgi:hypothetical protein